MDDLITLTKNLISIPSETHNTEACVQALTYAQQQLDGLNHHMFVSQGKPSALYTNQKNFTKHFTILLNAHLDVVAGEKHQFQPKEKDGKIYGRGAYDMKSAAAGLITAFREVAEKVSYPLGLQLVLDEECGSADGTAYQAKKGIYGDFVLIGEGSNQKIIHKSKGRLTLKITTHGKTAHSGYSWLGKNAILEMTTVIQKLKEAFPEPQEPLWDTLVNVVSIATDNTALNKIPKSCTAILDVRFVAEDGDTIFDKIKKLLPEGVSCETIFFDKPLVTKESHPMIQQLEKSIAKIMKQPAEFDLAYAYSDLSYFSQFQSAGVEFGIIGGGHHGEEEWVDIKSIQTYYEIVKDFLLSIDNNQTLKGE